MVKARGQAEAYAKALPAGEGWPPFLSLLGTSNWVRSQELISVKVNHMVRKIGDPDFRFPDNICGILFERRKVYKCCDVDSPGFGIPQHRFEFGVPLGGNRAV